MPSKINAVLIGMLLGITPCLFAETQDMVSFGIWPAERQKDDIMFCYGKDWNAIQIEMGAVKRGNKHKVKLPAKLVEPLVLEMNLPGSVKFLGANIHDSQGVSSDFPVESVTLDGKARQKARITLSNSVITNRLIKNKYLCQFYIWFDAPETLDDTASYRFLYGDEELATGSCRLVTAGVLRAARPMPERFGFYPWRLISSVPNNDYDRMADFYRRMGIKGMFANAHAALAENWQKIFEANRRHGVKNIAHMVHFVTKHGGTEWPARRDDTLANGGLVKLMDKICAGLESEGARADWGQLHGSYDMAVWDWEPCGPLMWPGYDDQAAIDAFAEKNGLTETLTPERLRTEYREAYFRFRMEQIARPLYSLRKTLCSVKPIHFRVEQGAGLHRYVDYDIYDDIADAHSPMIYQQTPVRYARNLLEMLKSTAAPARKFWPTITIGYAKPGVMRNTPQSMMMDTIVTAAAGCGGISHWPSIADTDALLFGVHEGLARIAMVEDFYLDGKTADNVVMTGLPYREQKIKLGQRTLDLPSPDWRAALITFANKLGDEYALTLLNYHTAEDAFVEINAPELTGFYLVNPVDNIYQMFNDVGNTTVRAGMESPEIWIATADKKRIEGCRLVGADEVRAKFDAARATFLKSGAAGAIELGAKGDINIAYGLTEFGGEERVSLQVTTPAQTIAFGSAGGRVYDWRVKGIADRFVDVDNFAISGLCKDLLWLPETTRWSGDEVQDLELVECLNDGHEARIVYEGEFRNAFPGIRLRKTYRVSAQGAVLRVEIILRNDTVDQAPLELAYWSHQMLAGKHAHFVNKELVHATERGVDTVFLAAGLADELKTKVVRGQVAGTVGAAYAEFFPDSRFGLIFRLPANVMNVHRWSPLAKTIQSSEWMSQPLSIPAGGSAALKFSITAVPEATVESLRNALAAPEPTSAAAANIFPFGFVSPDADEMLPDWDIRKSGDNADAVVISTSRDEAGVAALKVDIPRTASVNIDTKQRMELKPDTDYFITVDLKVEGMHHTGAWYADQRGLWIYVFGGEKHKRYTVVCGEGDTDGWVTAILPFSTRAVTAAPRVFFRCRTMTGTVYFRNPMLMENPGGMDLKNSFEMADGSLAVSPLRLSRREI